MEREKKGKTTKKEKKLSFFNLIEQRILYFEGWTRRRRRVITFAPLSISNGSGGSGHRY